MQDKKEDLLKDISENLIILGLSDFRDVLYNAIGVSKLHVIKKRIHNKALLYYEPFAQLRDAFFVQIISNVTFHDVGKFKNVPTFHFEKSVFVGFDGNIVICHDLESLVIELKKLNI